MASDGSRVTSLCHCLSSIFLSSLKIQRAKINAFVFCFLAGFVLDLLLLSIGFDEKSSFKETDEANLQSKGAR